MLDSDCDDILPLDWQTEAGNENGVHYKNLRSGAVVSHNPLTGAKRFLSPMPKHWIKASTDQELSVFINLETGARSYADPRLALPFLRTPDGIPTRRFKFDDLSTTTEFYLVVQAASARTSPPSDRWSCFSNASHLQPPSNGSLFWTYLDLNCMQSILDFANEYNKTSWPIHSLILAAATLPESFEDYKSSDSFDRVVQINFLSQVLLARLLQHRLRDTFRSTVVFVSCEALRAANIVEAEDVYSALDPLCNSYSWICGRVQLYANTKFLQVLFAAAFQEFLQRRKSRYPVILVCSPGNLTWQSKLISSASWTCWWWLKCLRFLAYPFSKSMECSAATLAFCALHAGTDMYRRRGKDCLYFNGCIPVSLPETALNPEMTRVIWAHVNALLEEKFVLPPW
ncbi:WW domain-containing oxidoreductase [Taenia crassiceps]|uniref:WW domain-containing oxidoreductase n=1 Tax=Taenia crassiceps TaxID=6207 RepID=A0ABR4Q5W4_9CEST